MAEIVYVLGAGFSQGLTHAPARRPPPLARTFFQVLMESGELGERSSVLWRTLPVEALLHEIERYWHLSPADLARSDLDIEECMTLFESLSGDLATAPQRRQELEAASFTLRYLLLMYLSWLHPLSTSPARDFGADVLARSADVLTLNYDTVA